MRKKIGHCIREMPIATHLIINCYQNSKKKKKKKDSLAGYKQQKVMALSVPKSLYIAHSKWKESPQNERKSLIPVLKELTAVGLG